MSLLRIGSGDAVCALRPDLGGAIVAWTIGEQPMFRTASEEAIRRGERLGFSTFPLVPFSNRIGGAAFRWNGGEYRLAPNFPPEPHRIHGSGWEDKWDIAEQEPNSVLLRRRSEADARWPWPFEAEQRIVLAPDALTLELSARNLAGEEVPLAFGHHPYFDMAGARMRFAAERVWLNGPDMLPTEAVAPKGPFDFSAISAVEGRKIDNCYTGVAGPCRIEWQGRPRALEIESGLGAAVVYIAPGAPAFCFEPVPHANNALNRPDAAPRMPVIAPGETFRATIRFRALPGFTSEAGC